MKHARNNSWILAVVAMAVFLFNTGCNGGAAAPPPPPPPPAIAVAITPGGAQSVDQGQSIKFTANVSNDSSNKGVTWTLTQNNSSCSPGCGTLSANSSMSGAPVTYTAPAAVNANLQLNVTATSVADTSKSSFDPTTAVPPPAPNSPAQLPAATVGQPYSFTLTEAGGVAPFTWSIKSGSLPPGLSLNSSTGVISGTVASAASSGSAFSLHNSSMAQPATAPAPVNFPFTVGVVDSGTPPLQASQPLAMAAVLAPLTISTSSLPNGAVGAAYSQTLAATGGNPPYTWSLVSGSLPTGLSMNGATGVISGTPTAAGSFTFKVQAADAAPSNQTAQQSLGITITTVAITSPNFFGGIIGNSFSATLTASGGTPPYTWSVGPALPAGLTLNASTGVISGTPTGPVATSNLTVQVTDSAAVKQTATQFLDITIGTKMSIATTSLPNGTVGTPYSANLAANGGISPIIWSLKAGALPAGLSLPTGLAGTIAGTPTGPAGIANFTVQATDSSSPPEVVTQALSITINPANTPQLAFARPSLPDGKIGAPYDQFATVVNGTAPITVKLISGALPAGLTLSTTVVGEISGTPTGPNGTASFTLQATDSSSPPQTAQMNYSISITNVGACVFDVTGGGPPNGNTSLQGTYVYRFQGFDSSGNAVARLGIFTADGNQLRDASQSFGHITALTEESMSTANGYTAPAALANSSYCIDPTTNITQITLGSVLYQAAITGNVLGVSDGISFIEFDTKDNVRGSGVMRLQKAAAIAQPASGTVNYVFGMSGRDSFKAPNVPVAVIGTFSLDTTLASAPGLSGSTGEQDIYDQAVNGLMNPTVTYPGITVALTTNNPLSATGRYTGALTSSPAAGDINFAAYVITAASGVLPSSNSPTLLFAISTGTPAKTVLGGEIVSQNFATESTFANSKIPKTPDARALTAPSSMFYVSGRDPAVTATSTSETSAAALGFIGFDGGAKNLGPGPSGNITNVELDIDVGGKVQGPITATNPPGATYTVAADGRTTFNGGSIPGLAYLSDFDTGFVLDQAGTIATAGFGRLLLSRNPGAGFSPILGSFALVGDVDRPVLDSQTTAGSVTNSAGGLNWTLDKDDPFSGLISNSTSPLALPFTKTDAFGRFTVGNCPTPPITGLANVCLVGYDSSAAGLLVLDETNTGPGPNLLPAWPSITIWGVVP